MNEFDTDIYVENKNLIDRQTTIDEFCSKCAVAKPETCSTIQKGDNWCEEIYAIQNMPSAQPKPQWIPCSERLPDVAQRILLSGHGMVMIGMLHSFGKYSLEPTGISYAYPKDDIEAWMPLPEPYKEASE